MAGVTRQGQAFIMGAVILALMVLLIYSSYTGFFVQSPSGEPQRFFERSIQEPGNVFGKALEENYSVENVKQEIYSWNRFVKSRAQGKGLEYGSIHVFVLPSKGEAVLINYQDTKQDVNLTVNGNTRTIEVPSKQHITEEFSDTKVSVQLTAEDKNLEQSFEAYNPRMLTFVEVSSSDETWRNHLIN